MTVLVIRDVEDVTAYRGNPSGDLIPVGQGITHYRTDWVDGMVGDDILAALIDAGLPDGTYVRYAPEGQQLVVTIPGNDAGAYQATLQIVLGEATEGS